MKIILASGSPRRYDLLKQIGWDVEVRSLPFAEVETVNEATEQLTQLRNHFLSAASTQQNATSQAQGLTRRQSYYSPFFGLRHGSFFLGRFQMFNIDLHPVTDGPSSAVALEAYDILLVREYEFL